MGKTFRISGSLSSGSFATITPAPNEVWIIQHDCFHFHHQFQAIGSLGAANKFGYGIGPTGTTIGAFHPFYSDAKPFIPFMQGAPTTLPGEIFAGGGSPTREFVFRNVTGGAVDYMIYGDVSDLVTEGIEEIICDGVQESSAGFTYDALVPQAGKSYLVSCLASNRNTNYFQILDVGTGAVLADFVQNYYGGFSKFWLWSDMNVKLRFTTVGGQLGSGVFRAVRYNDATIPEFADRLAIKQAVSFGSYVDLRPADNTEIWYIDLHNWPGNYMYPNGGATPESTIGGLVSRFRVSFDQWYRMKNNDGAGSRTLYVTGAKAKA